MTSSPGDLIRDVSILTRDRPLLLERCLASLRAQPNGDAAPVRVRILDDGRNPDPGHIRLTDRRTIARRLAAAAGIDRTVVEFAVCGMKDAGPAIGAQRNTSLLLNAGRKYLQVDDDVICTPYVWRSADERRVEVSRDESGVTVQWYAPGSAPLAELRPASEGFVEAHQRFLGRTVAGLTVRVTQNSLMGDCGCAGPWWKTLRSSAGDRYRSELLSREVLRKVDAVTVSRYLSATAFAMAIDATRLVPPFLPCGRGEDALFVFLLNVSDEHACEVQLPAIAEHRPDQRPPFERTVIVNSITHLAVPALLQHLLADSVPHGATLDAIAARLLDLCRSGWKSVGDELVPRVAAGRRMRLRHIEALLERGTEMPDERRADLRDQAAVLKTSIERESGASLLQDIAAAHPQLGDEERIVRFLRLFGELLQGWSTLWSAALVTELDPA